ncbi:MAG: hypothetical protein R3C99_27435 [Pirellulaceae bacterium]
MVKSVFEQLSVESPKQHFTISIRDDVTRLSLDWDSDFNTESSDVIRAVFYGLGSDRNVKNQPFR